jgi:hypothetical protein
MIQTIENNKGNSISYEFLTSEKIRISSHGVSYKYSESESELIMFDFNGGPILTIGAIPSISGVNAPITKIEKMNNEYGFTEVIIYV